MGIDFEISSLNFNIFRWSDLRSQTFISVSVVDLDWLIF